MSATAFAMETELPLDDSGDSDSELPTTSTSPLVEADTSAGDPLAEPPGADERAPYQVMPALTPEEYAALKADIERHGVQVPVLMDEHGNIIDGHHRKQIADELGIECPVETLGGLTEAAKRERAVALNLQRRRLTREQKQSVIAKYLAAAPAKSDRAIARSMGVDHKTVGSVRRLKEATGEIPQSEQRIGRDNRSRPASPKAQEKKTKANGAPARPLGRESVIERFSEDCIAIKKLHEGGKLGAQDAFCIATRAKSLLSYTLGKLRDTERVAMTNDLSALIAEFGGAS